MDRSHLFRKAKCGVITYLEEDYNSDKETFESLFSVLEEFQEMNMGRGVRSTIKIKARTFLGEYTGLKLSRAQAMTRMNGNPCHYVVGTSYPHRFIDGEGGLGNILKFVNHRCKGYNCKLTKLTRGRVGLETIKEILPGESLSYNYRHYYFEGHIFKQTKCLCSVDCSNYF